MHQDPFNIFPHSSTPAHRILPELWFNQNKMLIFHDESNLLLCLLGPRLCGTRCPSRTPTWLLRWELVIQLIKQKRIYLQLVEMSFYTPTPQWCGCVRPRVCLAQSDIIVNCSDRLQPWLGVGRGVTELAWFKKKSVCVCVDFCLSVELLLWLHKQCLSLYCAAVPASLQPFRGGEEGPQPVRRQRSETHGQVRRTFSLILWHISLTVWLQPLIN